ncbi:hypothetical protein C3L33_00633, partial [Rhododendron williamsianum]
MGGHQELGVCVLTLEHGYPFFCMGLGGERTFTGGCFHSHPPAPPQSQHPGSGQTLSRRLRECRGAEETAQAGSEWPHFHCPGYPQARPPAREDSVPGVARDFVTGPHYGQWLYMAGFFAYFLSYYVLPDYPIDGLSQAVFPLAVLLARGQPVALAPLFLGSLYRQLDLVQADYARSLGRCDHLSMVHTNFLLAYFFKHFRAIAPVPLAFQASGQRSRAEQWQGTSSNASWYEACDVKTNFTPRPFNITSPGVMGMGLCLLPTSSSLNAASGGDSVARTVVNSTLIALPGWLPFLNNEAAEVVVYRPDRYARQLSFDQGVPGPAPPMPSFTESQLRFMANQLTPILMQLGDLPIPARDRVAGYTPEFRLFWRRNLDSFLTFVRGHAVIPEVSMVRVRDTSLRAITEVQAVDWRGPHSQWVVIDVAPLNREFPAMPPPPPEAAPRRTSARVTRGRTQPPTPAGPSQPSSSQAPAAGEARRHKRVRTQRERDASTFVAFEPEAAAVAETKRRRLEKGIAVVAIFDSPKEQREVEVIQPRTGPVPFPHSEPKSSAVVGVYSVDCNPSPSNAASSEVREPPPPMDTRESMGQAEIAAEPINATVAQLLREEEEDDVEELPHATVGGPSVDRPGAGSISTPSSSQQQYTSARIRSTESFLGRVAGGSPGVSNASFLQGPGSDVGRDIAADATSPHSPACSTSQTHSPHPSARHASTPPAQVPLAVED